MKKIFNNNISKSKSKAVSVQSIIIGSVITSILGTVGISIMFPSIIGGEVSRERSRIEGIQSNFKNSGFYNKTVHTKDFTKDMNLLPHDKKYLMFTISEKPNIIDDNDLGVVLRLVDYRDTERVDKFRSIVDKLNDKIDYDSNVSTENNTGKFRFNSTCSNDNNCYYSVSGITKFGTKEHSIEIELNSFQTRQGVSLLEMTKSNDRSSVESSTRLYSYSVFN